MHIVQLLPELTQGGVERCVVELNRDLIRLGHQSTVISAGGRLSEQIERDGGRHISFDLCSKNPLTFPFRVSKLRKILKQLMRNNDPQMHADKRRLGTEENKLAIGNYQSSIVIHAHSRVPAWLCTAANRPLRIPFITTVHGFNHVSPYSRVMTRGVRVICVSNQVKEYIQTHYGLSEETLRVIPCGVDPQEFDPARTDETVIKKLKDTFELNGKTIISAVGRIARSKNYETFIRAIAICAENNPSIRGLIVGATQSSHRNYRNTLEKLVQKLGVKDQIIFTGSQTHLPEIYAFSDIVVSSSGTPETFGLTLIEALAMNTPVIAPRHGGPLDIISEGENGRFFAPADAADLAKQIDAALTDRPREFRSDTIRRFAATATAAKTLAVYKELLNSLHVVQVIPELNQGGVERGTVELNRELVKRGHASTVISAGGKQSAQIEKDGGQHITLDVCSKNPLTFPFRVHALRSLISDLRPSVIHARSRVPAWLCRFANRKLKIPFVTTVHGFNSVSRYSEIMTRGDRVIYGSSSIKEYILKHYRVDENKLRYVPRGIDMEYFDPDQTDRNFIASFKKQHGLEGKTVISIVGRITEWKGHDTFIRALAKVQKNHPEVVGLAAGGIWHGKDEFFQGLEKLADELGADIRFVGSQSQVREIYALSDLIVSAASTKAETFGRTAAEALAMNTPVVASAQGGSLDIIRDKENGLCFSPGDAEDLAKKMEQALAFDFCNMRNWVQFHFSLDRMTEDELAVYGELIQYAF